MVALEHLKELDNLLKEEGVSFAPEASFHLGEMAAAVTDLESDRRAAHEHVEVETIENSKLRRQTNTARERMSREIEADVAATRASNAEEIEQLHKELSAVSQLREATVKRQEALLSQNEAMCPHREQGKAEHGEIIATLNNQISLKYGLQTKLDQTQEKIEELRSCIAAVEQDKITLGQNMVLEREAVTVKKGNLSSEENGTGEKIKQQTQGVRMSRRELERVNGKKLEAHGQLGELTADGTKLERNLQRQMASRGQFEKQLEGETEKRKDLGQQREKLKKELCESGEVFSLAIRCLKKNIATMESKIEEGQATRLLCQDHLTCIYEMFRRQHDEESEVRAEHFRVSQQLERSELQLAERIASVVKHNREIKEMDKQIRELLEADTINKCVFERNQEELCANVDTEKKNIRQLEEEKSMLRRLLEEGKRKQEEHMAKTTARISGTRRRYEELRREEAMLQQRQPASADADLLMSHVTQCVATYRQIEIECLWEIEQSTAETEGITWSSEEKRREAKGKEETLKEEEAKWNEEQSRHQRLNTITSELRRRRTELELSIQGLREKTSFLLQPREEMKTELEEMRASRVGTLDKQASELRAVEMSIYDTSVKLEQVGMENSRLRLCVRQMMEDVSRVGGNRDRYWQEIHQFHQDKKALFESLQEAWREDLLVTEDCHSSDGVLLACMSSLNNHLKMRKHQLAHVNKLLHQQMLDFSERLGDKTTAEQCS
ncbi:putative coiled-coil domain-containing protein 175 [Scophthalmus maximus]|uniref:Putative coiled-coil domain-containing protein 175 n=1 Tax=Scophthalmus maximus TaxID=52904 RepID=A0A2U9BSH2_SCOMX|nr:putative coiled-coil domain-containing protein 175 [Scophthalmus maximus]